MIAIIARPDRPAPARRPGGPRGRPPRPVHQQPQADRPGGPQLPRRQRRLPDRQPRASSLRPGRPTPATRPIEPQSVFVSMLGPARAAAALQRHELQPQRLHRRELTVFGTGLDDPLVPERRRRSADVHTPHRRRPSSADSPSVHQLRRLHRRLLPRGPGHHYGPTRRPPEHAGQRRAVNGIDHLQQSPIADITDGTSNTILFGERAHGLLTPGRPATLVALVGRRRHRRHAVLDALSDQPVQQDPATSSDEYTDGLRRRRPRASTPAGPTSPSPTARSGSSRTRSTPGASTRRPATPSA